MLDSLLMKNMKTAVSSGNQKRFWRVQDFVDATAG